MPAERRRIALAGRPEAASGLARTLRRRGSTFLSAGRYLALRADVAPPGARAELAELTEEVPPLPWQEARAVLWEALGRDPDRVLSSLDPLPVVATGLWQVHRAGLSGGRSVAVKLLRPDARRRVDEVLGRAGELQRLLDPSIRARGGAGDRWVADLRAWLEGRLDLRQELANLQRLDGEPDGRQGERQGERVPRPHPELCSERLLVTSWLGGTPLLDLLQAGVRDAPEPWRDLEVEPAQLARNLVEATLGQVFDRGFFCADVHPANVVALAGSAVSFASYDDCAAVDPASREAQLAYLVAVFDDDVERMLAPPVERGEAPDPAAAAAFRKELLGVMRERSAAEPDGDRGELLVAMVRAAGRHGIPLADGLAAVSLTVAGVAALAARLDGATGARDSMRVALRCRQLTTTLGKLEPERLQPTLISLVNLVHDAPIQVQKLLADLAEGSFGLGVQVSEAPRVTSSRDHHARLLTVAICSVGVALLVTASGLPRPFGVSLAWPLGAVLAGIWGWLVRELRRLE
jgi:ubiquinone biosynthesis protein